jgi:polyhydroxyalkanoate synthesis regulator phasin
MDIIRKAVLLGIGIISLTKDKAEEMVDELIKRGEIASTEKFQTVDKLLKEADRQQKEIERKIAGTVQKIIADMGLPTRRDLEEITEMLKKIEAKISGAENKDAG